jgi:hypothetical protein
MPKNNKPELKNGERFNRLTILRYSHSDKRWRRWYFVRCDCGKEKTVMGSAMISGNTKSCGCLAKEMKQNKRISENHSDVTAIILGYKRHAESRGHKWCLTRVDVLSIISENCFYCGAPPSNIKKTKNSIGDGLPYSGIDRVDSSHDYVRGNIVPCCRICNYAKSAMDINQFRDWAIKIGTKAMATQWSNTKEETT